ncbi:carbohydrate ABC transporter permease [Microbacterium sp. p3-SID338]|uniref:carbohydrate ABC transporter permease n=1 Tax=unclassified Microbacterium TaxID=2609290 RepID=UPI0009EF34E1|nr:MULTISPECIES: carbohydrate ABC transporter permease [unclassified Microbacterium]MCT1394823.1 carbohydrate ABC transporter permease [Microbacterium sp. p3-SID338]PMC02013.1 carbohydrate ABC transporter permease [Microbacterium sp. UMB0228]
MALHTVDTSTRVLTTSPKVGAKATDITTRSWRPKNPLANVTGLLVALLWLVPVYWMVNSAFQSDSELMSWPPHLLPQEFTWGNFISALTNPHFAPALGSSLLAASLTVVFSTIGALTAAYALSRFRFRGRTIMIIAILVVQMIPAEALFISQYRMLDGWGLLNSVLGLSILYIGTIVPFVAWMTRGFVDGVPIELEEAAMVDGCSRFGAFRRVTLPLLAPGLVSTSVFSFLFAWNEYTLALIVLSKDSSVTLPIWIQSFQQGLKATDWGGVMAGATLIAVPVIIIFMAVQNKISQGMVAGAVKG